MNSLSNKFIQPIENAQIQLPSTMNSNINNNQTISLRVCLFSMNFLRDCLFISYFV